MKRLLTIALTGMLTVSMLVPAWADEISANEAEEVAVEAAALEETEEAELEEADEAEDEDVIYIDEDDLVEITDEEAAAMDGEEIVLEDASTEEVSADAAEETVSEEAKVESEVSENSVDIDFADELQVDDLGYYSNYYYSYTFAKGMVANLGAQCYHGDGSWVSNNPAVVSVTPAGVATAKKNGTAVLTYYCPYRHDNTYVTIKVGKKWVVNTKSTGYPFDITLMSVTANEARFKIYNNSSFTRQIKPTKITIGSKSYKVKSDKIKIRPFKSKTFKFKKKINLKKIGAGTWAMKFKYWTYY